MSTSPPTATFLREPSCLVNPGESPPTTRPAGIDRGQAERRHCPCEPQPVLGPPLNLQQCSLALPKLNVRVFWTTATDVTSRARGRARWLDGRLKVINHASPYIASLNALRAVATIRCVDAIPTGRGHLTNARFSGSRLLRRSSIRSLSSYGMDLLRWYRFLWATEVPCGQATRMEARGFCRWMLVAGKPSRPHWRNILETGTESCRN